jgi:phosphate transport system permease protein
MTTTIDRAGDEPSGSADTSQIPLVTAESAPPSATHLAAAPVTTQVKKLTVGAQQATSFNAQSAADAADRPRVIESPRDISHATLDDRMSFWGSMLGSFGLVWVLYYQILPFSGRVGFVVCWWFVFLAMYAGVSAMGNPSKVVTDRVVTAMVTSGALMVFLALASAVLFTFVRGFDALVHVNFFTQDMAGVRPTDPLDKGGIVHAIIGSAIEIGIAVIITLPLGIGAAVYMNEFSGPFARAVRTIVEAMTALPSIVAGLFIYTTLIVIVGISRTGFAAAMAISVMMLPIIARSADVVLRVMPGGLREASLALGASKWQTVRQVVLPTVRSGLATALILGIARGVGETSPVLLTSGASTFTNINPFNEPMNSLPLFVFSSVRSGEPLYISRGFGAAAVLLILVLLLFVLTRFLARQKVGSR